MFFQKPEPVATVSFYGIVTTSISAIWLCSKLVSFVSSYMTSTRPVLEKHNHYQKDKCHCHLWHSNCDIVKVGWHKNDDIRWEQNYEISRAFLSVEVSVEQLSSCGSPMPATAEKILQDAIIYLKSAKHKSFLTEYSDGFARDQEYAFVANSLKDAWPVVAPKLAPSRHYVELFCKNLKEKKDLFYSMAEEHHSLLEYLQYMFDTDSTYTRRIMEVFKKHCHLIPTKDLLQVQSLSVIVENILKNNSETVDVKLKLRDALNILKQEGIKTGVIAMNAEMVGAGKKGEKNMLARISLVNKYGCVYDKFINPTLRVTDYRKFSSGIKPHEHLGAVTFKIAQREVRDLIKDCILVGHDLELDLEVLGLSHPAKDIRDTAYCRFFRRDAHEKPSLQFIASSQMGRIIQDGEHDSVENARAALDVYLKYRDTFEWIEEHSLDIIAYTNPNERVRALQETNRFFP